MIEPLLGVSIPAETASAGKFHRAGDAAEMVLLLQQVFDNVCAQQNLADVCRLCANQAGVRLVAVEGADHELLPMQPPKSIRHWIEMASPVSAGVLHLQASEPDLIDVWGVDEMDLNKQSQGAMIRVMQNSSIRDGAFALLRPLLVTAQQRIYGKDVGSLRMNMLSVYGVRAGIGKQIEMLETAAAQTGLDLRAFPLVRRFGEIQVKEKEINSGQVQSQTVQFMKRLQEKLFDWVKPVSRTHVDIDLQKAKPVMEYWMEMTGVTAEEMDQNVERRGLESTILECKQWLENSIIEEARRQGVQGQGTPHIFYEEMMRLALRLGVSFFDLRDFRELIAINRDMQAIKRGILDEVKVASRAVVEKLGSAAIEFLQLEERLDLFYRALRLEVPPGEAEAAEINADSFHKLLESLKTTAGVRLSETEDLRRMDQALADAANFLQLSKKRSRHMATRTLELMHERGDDRAILVAGGFHERAITRAFEDARGVSWSVLAPTPDLSELKKS
jgi:hypothetical protein